MPRPRLHDPEAILDAAERLVARGGSAALTTRALAAQTGAPSGSLYHAFGSRPVLLAQLWLRAARRFLDLQREAAEAALPDDPVEATVRAALAPLTLFERAPDTARVLLGQRREELLAAELPAELAAQLAGLDGELVDLFRRLAGALWERRDRHAVEAVRACVVDLPTGLLLGHLRAGTVPRDTDLRLRAAARAVLSLNPPARS
ncbi:MAG TPA: TetR family transcriptional regulator [Capillimicrobium sp.]|jgi:AcrR family transcriptional regulator